MHIDIMRNFYNTIFVYYVKLGKEDLIKKYADSGICVRRQWFSAFLSVLKYYIKNGNIDIKLDYKDEKGFRSGLWVYVQRKKYNSLDGCKLSKVQIDLLNSLEIKWNYRDEVWDEYYDELQIYHKEHGNIDVPKCYVTNKKTPLGSWLGTQRSYYRRKLLPEWKILLLNDLGMKWDYRNDNWEENYKILKKYFEKYGHINVPQSYVTVDGIGLGLWLASQRSVYQQGKRTNSINERIKLLNILGMDWNIKDTRELNKAITDKNTENYGKILSKRLNSTLDDLIYEGFNEINNQADQDSIENVLIKRLWK